MEAVKSPQQEAVNSPQQEAKDLLKWAFGSNWDEVEARYRLNPETHKVRITRSKDTALHIAVLDQKEDVVEKLVTLLDEAAAKKKGNGSESGDLIVKEEGRTPKDHPLWLANERGNTPLHLAASIGNVQMCNCIAQKHKDLVGARNNVLETPLFLAALHGKKEAFLSLHKILQENGKGKENYRNNKGETILHCAIAGEYFDLAYQIVDKYGEILANSFDEGGHTPLHLLASKPAVFKSGSHLGFFSQIIYHCISVKNLKVIEEELSPQSNATSNDEKYPMIYQTCANFLNVLTKMWTMVTNSGVNKKGNSGGQTTSPNQGISNYSHQEQSSNCLKDLLKSEDLEEGRSNSSQNKGNKADQLCPANYLTCFSFIKFLYSAMMVVLGIGAREITKIREMKEKHGRAVQIMEKLLGCASTYGGSEPETHTFADMTRALIEGNEEKGQKDQKADGKRLITFNIKDKGFVFDVDFSKEEVSIARVEGNKQTGQKETPILMAAKNGITEMVEAILHSSPMAIHDKNSAEKNIVMLAAENRQPKVYELLLEKKNLTETMCSAVDNEGNSVLHLVAMATHHQPWLIPGAALQMQWEIKWYKYVEHNMPRNFTMCYNKANKTAKEIFTEKHEELVKNGSEWLNSTSNSCSVVAALIATVAFATSATVPGGINEGKGTPTLEHTAAFNVFSISSLIALCFSVNSLVMFLAILTSRQQEKDFGSTLPNKLLFGLSSLFVSIGAILISFCAGHFFVLKDELKYAALPIYAVTCLPVAFFAVMQFPLYLDLIWATFRKVPKRSSTSVS